MVVKAADPFEFIKINQEIDIRLVNNWTSASSAGNQNITGASFPIAANEIWSFEFGTVITRTSGDGTNRPFAFGVNGPSGMTLLGTVMNRKNPDDTSSARWENNIVTTLNTTVQIGGSGTAANDLSPFSVIVCCVVVASSTPGTVQLLHSQSNVTNMTYTYDGNSYITARRIS